MDPKNAIEIRNIVKTFKIEVEDPEKKGGILNRNHTKTIENKVLDGITLDIRKGDVLGVLGRNGSGKSTFLSMIARIMEPDSGTIECSGRSHRSSSSEWVSIRICPGGRTSISKESCTGSAARRWIPRSTG